MKASDPSSNSSLNLTHRPAWELAQRIRQQEVTAVEVVQGHLDQIKQHNPQIQAVSVLAADEALESARQADQELSAGSSEVGSVAWYDKNSGRKTHSVCGKKKNKYGLCDMSGNVWEWVWDWKGSYSSSSQADPVGPSSGSIRVSRGGSWSSDAGSSRVSNRGDLTPSIRYGYLGFRLSRSASAQ